MNIVVGVDSVRYPMSGIGVYSYQLCKQYLARGDVNVIGLGRYGLFNSRELEIKLNLARVEPSFVGLANKVKFSRVLLDEFKASSIVRALHHRTSKFATVRNLRRLDDSFIYHVPNFIGYGERPRKVVTIHDLSHIDCEGMHPPSRVAFMKDQLRDSIASAKRIIVDSDFTRERLLESGLIGRRRESDIFKVYLGVSDEFTKLANQGVNEPLLTRFNLKQGGYFLALGTIEPRKNYVRLVEAYLSLPKSIVEQYPLVVCGALGWGYEPFLKLVESVKQPYRVVLTGHVAQKEISSLVASASALVYPSIYEGFGMPVLEAMKCGVPVITSGIGATLEVSSDAAIHIDPYSVQEISDAMSLISSSEELAKKYSIKGLSRSSEFSWSQCATETLEVYKTLG